MCNDGLLRVEGRKEKLDGRKRKEAIRGGENASCSLFAVGHDASHGGQDPGSRLKPSTYM